MTGYPEILQDLLDKLVDLLSRKGIPEETAQNLATETVETIRKDWGGLNVYIPKGKIADPSERDLEIYKRFNEQPRVQLCREFKISEQRLYQIVKTVGEKEKVKNKGKTDS